MVNVYLNLSIFTVFLKNNNFISKIRISKVTDYAALKIVRHTVVLVFRYEGELLWRRADILFQTCIFDPATCTSFQITSSLPKLLNTYVK